MAHINYHRNVRFYGRLPLAEALPTENWQANFAAFCGRIEQRREAGLQAIRRCIGRVGIILLQNDSLLAEEIERLPEALPAPGSSRQDVGRIYSINPPASSVHYIAPLYGMNHEEVLNAIIPTSGDNDSRAAVVAARDGLNAYLRILELQFLHSRARNPQFSGRSPYRLDLLEQLVALSYQDLDRQVLNQLPETERRPIRETLSSDGRILLVRGWVNDFTSLMSSTLWTRQSEVRHGTIGIRDAMLHRSLINISLPNPSPALLRYLLCELNSLRTANIDFLLVAAETSLAAFPPMCQLFTDPHTTARYRTGLLSADASCVLSPTQMGTALGSLLSQHHEVLIFRCDNASQATPFSAALGSYQRIIREQSHGRSRQPFAFFSSHETGIAQHEVTEYNVTINDLIGRADGAILCGALYPTPLLIGHVFP